LQATSDAITRTRHRERRDFAFDPLDDGVHRETVRHPHAIAHGTGARSAVADNGHAVDAQERGASVFGIAGDGAQLDVQQTFDHFDEPFADFQRDVAGEAVADDHIRLAAVHVARLDVADEGRHRRLEQPV
jgi:hypothetical protein